MAKSNEPFVWSLFGAGGMVAALFTPICIIITAILVPLGLIPAVDLFALFGKILVRLFLFVLISLSLFHWAHRFRFTLVDLGLKAVKVPIALVCYVAALAGTLLTAIFLLGLWK
jgi:fumarate reductase subunit D